MAEILVTEIRARRLSAAGDCFYGRRDDRAMGRHALGFPPVPIALRLFFLFLPHLQCLAL